MNADSGKPLDVASQQARRSVEEDQQRRGQNHIAMPQGKGPSSPGTTHVGQTKVTPGGDHVTNAQAQAHTASWPNQ